VALGVFGRGEQLEREMARIAGPQVGESLGLWIVDALVEQPHTDEQLRAAVEQPFALRAGGRLDLSAEPAHWDASRSSSWS
jgi:hypothetical protein